MRKTNRALCLADAHLASKICVVLGIVLFVMSTGLLFVAWLNTFSDGNGDVSFFVVRVELEIVIFPYQYNNCDLKK